MKPVVLQLSFDLPADRELLRAVLGAYNGPQEPAQLPAADSAPEPSQGVIGVIADAAGDDLAEWPAGACPVHGAATWRESNFGGFYCTSQAQSGEPADKKGRCRMKSGFVYEGKRIPAGAE